MNERENKTHMNVPKLKHLYIVFAVLLIAAVLAACSGAKEISVSAAPSADVSSEPSAVSTPSPTPVKTTPPDVAPTPGETVSSTPKATQPQEPTQEPSQKPSKQPAEKPSQGGQPLSGVTIGLDAGHQSHANSDKEPVSPGSADMKSKVSSGTQGRFTRVPEYKVNLQVALKLKDKLEALGAAVIMTRETNDVDISNAERAKMMNDSNVDCWLRIHANGNDNPDVYGMFMLVPKDGCLDTSDSAVQEASVSLGKTLLKDAVASSGAKDLGLQPRGDQSGFNWSKLPVCNIEMGYMTNENEDNLLVSDDYQESIADGLAQGFVDYFSK